ncbi:MAG: MFS family permease [Parvibaculaceae bacterium]|mgnify:CR=1 FL=1|jgi:MFS family permease
MTAQDVTAEEKYQAEVRTNLKRNFIVHWIHGLLGQTGFRLLHAPTFVPAYIFLLSDSYLAVGLALAVQHLGAAVSSIFGATLIEHRKRVLPVGLIVGTLMRLQVLGLALSGLLLGPEWALIAAMVFLCLFGLFNGMQAVMFNYLLSKVIPVDLRGRLTGLRNFSAGLTSAAVAYYGGQYFIETNALGNGYASTFLVSFILTSLGLTTLFLVIEPEPPEVRTPSRLGNRIKELPALLREDKAFTRFFIARSAAALGTIAVPFYVIYAGQRLDPTGHLSGSTIAVLSLTFLLCQTATNLFWGFVADKAGNRLGYILSVSTWVLATLGLFAATGMWSFALVFAALGAGLGGFQITSQNLVMEFGPRHDLPMRIAVSNTGLSLMMALGPLLGGLVSLGYDLSLIFMLAILFKSVSIAIMVLFVDEPRHRPTT